ncbi:MAG: hypothetical protein FD127_765 [Acidimicrobiaceae bacterium]|nr:MAG: hypothetical protein FD127_765 [Acidimicrobiaceae bacterium]
MPGDELHAVARELPGSDLRPGQIGEHPDDRAVPLGGRTHGPHPMDVLVDGSVRQVEPDDVDAGDDQPVEHLRRLTRRSEGGDDLRS